MERANSQIVLKVVLESMERRLSYDGKVVKGRGKVIFAWSSVYRVWIFCCYHISVHGLSGKKVYCASLKVKANCDLEDVETSIE